MALLNSGSDDPARDRIQAAAAAMPDAQFVILDGADHGGAFRPPTSCCPTSGLSSRG